MFFTIVHNVLRFCSYSCTCLHIYYTLTNFTILQCKYESTWIIYM